MFKKYLKLFLLLPIVLSAFNDTDYEFKQININDGLSQSMIFAIMQDKVGYMWFGTANGLNRYDGYEFKVYRNNSKDSTSISDNGITSIYEDEDGYIWIGTNEGVLNRFDRKTETFKRFHITDNEDFLLIQPDEYFSYPIIFSRNNNKTITSIAQDETGDLWIGTWGKGVIRFNPNNNKTDYYYRNPADPNSISYNRVTKIIVDQSGLIWVGTFGGGLNRVVKWEDSENEDNSIGFYSYQMVADYESSLSDDKIVTLFEDESGNIWIGTFGGGINVLGKEEKSLTRDDAQFIMFENDFGDGNSLCNNNVMAIEKDSDGNMWFGTFGGGLDLYDSSTNEFSHFYNSSDSKNSLADNEIISLFIDRSGILWIGTHLGKGISKLESNKNKFKAISKSESSNKGLNDDLVWALFEDNKEDLWIGTYRGGVNVYNRKNDTFSYFNTIADKSKRINDNHIRSITEDDEGNIWIGTYSGGLNHINRKNGKITIIQNRPGDNSSLGANQIQALTLDDEGNLWIGTFGGGLNKINLSEQNGKIPSDIEVKRYVNYPFDKQSISDNRIYSLYNEKNGSLWVGTFGGGLNKFDKKTETFESFVSDPKNPNSISSNRIMVIHGQNENTLWIGTYGGGLNRFDKNTKEFKVYGETEGLNSDAIYGILEGKEGELWLSGDNGLIKFDLETERFTQYDIDDGLQSMEFSGGSYAKLKDGSLCFGGINGFNIFHPDSIKTTVNYAPVVINNIRIFNKPLKGERTSLTLEYDQNFFSFGFASLEYKNSQDAIYEYMLQGLEEDWQQTSSKLRIANYTNVAPGEYLFKVRRKDATSPANSGLATVELKILPPFWLTWWFILLSFIAAAALISYLSILRYRQLLAIEKLKTRLAADLHDNIGAGLTEISIMSELVSHNSNNEASKPLLSKISNRARDLVDGMSDIVWVVNPQKDSLHDIILRLRDTYNDLFTQMNISFKNNNLDEIIDLKLPIDYKQHLYLIFKEAINNAIKHSGCSLIELKVIYNSGQLIITLKDDGKGIEEKDINYGNGIQNMRNRTKQINGQIVWESAPGSGTQIKFTGQIKKFGFLEKLV